MLFQLRYSINNNYYFARQYKAIRDFILNGENCGGLREDRGFYFEFNGNWFFAREQITYDFNGSSNTFLYLRASNGDDNLVSGFIRHVITTQCA